MEVTSNPILLDARLRDLFHLVTQGNSPALDHEFQTLALDLFQFQFTRNEPFGSLCEARGLAPKSIQHWREIPVVPVSAFKELEFSCLPPVERTHVFHSSGTTGQGPSRHFHNAASLSLYEASLLAWFGKCFSFFEREGPRGENIGRAGGTLPMLFLTPPVFEAPHSSLVYMFDAITRKWASRESAFVGRTTGAGAWTIDFELLKSKLCQLSSSSAPVFVFGTAFLFVHLLDFFRDHKLRFRLPPGSIVLETGGYKGRSRFIPRLELHELIAETFGLTPRQIVCEYGMCELSSQAYSLTPAHATDQPSPSLYQFPPWARAQIISPETGREVEPGETGLLRILDLANVYSAIAIQTEDLAIRHGASFELLGRSEAAESRGCSLLAAQP